MFWYVAILLVIAVVVGISRARQERRRKEKIAVQILADPAAALLVGTERTSTESDDAGWLPETGDFDFSID